MSISFISLQKFGSELIGGAALFIYLFIYWPTVHTSLCFSAKKTSTFVIFTGGIVPIKAHGNKTILMRRKKKISYIGRVNLEEK